MSDEEQMNDKDQVKRRKDYKPKNFNRKMRRRDIDQKTNVASGFDLLEEKLFSKFLKGMAKSYPKLSEKMDFESERTKDDQISFAKANEVFDSIWRSRNKGEGAYNFNKINFCEIADRQAKFPMNSSKCKKQYEKFCQKRINPENFSGNRKMIWEKSMDLMVNNTEKMYNTIRDTIFESEEAELENRILSYELNLSKVDNDSNHLIENTRSQNEEVNQNIEPNNYMDSEFFNKDDVDSHMNASVEDKKMDIFKIDKTPDNVDQISKITGKESASKNTTIEEGTNKILSKIKDDKWQSPRMLRKSNFMSLREKKVRHNLKEKKTIDKLIETIELPDMNDIQSKINKLFQKEWFKEEITKNQQYYNKSDLETDKKSHKLEKFIENCKNDVQEIFGDREVHDQYDLQRTQGNNRLNMNYNQYCNLGMNKNSIQNPTKNLKKRQKGSGSFNFDSEYIHGNKVVKRDNNFKSDYYRNQNLRTKSNVYNTKKKSRMASNSFENPYNPNQNPNFTNSQNMMLAAQNSDNYMMDNSQVNPNWEIFMKSIAHFMKESQQNYEMNGNIDTQNRFNNAINEINQQNNDMQQNQCNKPNFKDIFRINHDIENSLTENSDQITTSRNDNTPDLKRPGFEEYNILKESGQRVPKNILSIAQEIQDKHSISQSKADANIQFDDTTNQENFNKNTSMMNQNNQDQADPRNWNIFSQNRMDSNLFGPESLASNGQNQYDSRNSTFNNMPNTSFTQSNLDQNSKEQAYNQAFVQKNPNFNEFSSIGGPNSGVLNQNSMRNSQDLGNYGYVGGGNPSIDGNNNSVQNGTGQYSSGIFKKNSAGIFRQDSNPMSMQNEQPEQTNMPLNSYENDRAPIQNLPQGQDSNANPFLGFLNAFAMANSDQSPSNLRNFSEDRRLSDYRVHHKNREMASNQNYNKDLNKQDYIDGSFEKNKYMTKNFGKEFFDNNTINNSMNFENRPSRYGSNSIDKQETVKSFQPFEYGKGDLQKKPSYYMNNTQKKLDKKKNIIPKNGYPNKDKKEEFDIDNFVNNLVESITDNPKK